MTCGARSPLPPAETADRRIGALLGKPSALAVGFDGSLNRFGTLAPGTSVQINNPRGLSIGLDGELLFADTDNHLIRAYVPSSGHVIDALPGVVSNGAPHEGGSTGTAAGPTRPS